MVIKLPCFASAGNPKETADNLVTAVVNQASDGEGDASTISQIYLLSVARGVFQMSRICMGPLVVVMTVEYKYTTEQKGQILSAFAGGYLFTQVVGGIAADWYGGAPIISFGLVTSGAALILLPFVADAGVDEVWWLLWLMGFFQGPTFPAQLVATAAWVTGSLRSYASALGATASTAGALCAMGLTPIVADRIGWRVASLLLGCATLFFGLFWWIAGRSRPPSNQILTKEGAEKGQHGSRLSNFARCFNTLASTPVIALYAAHCVHNFVRYFVLGWMPTYYSDVLRETPESAAGRLVLPDAIGLCMSFASAHAARGWQRDGYLSTLGVRRLFSTLSFVASMLGLMVTAEANSSFQVTAGQCLVSGLATLQGLGYGANYLDVSKHNGGLVTGFGNTLATFASYASPMFASWMLTPAEGHANRPEDWKLIFYAFSASNLIGLLIFVPFCSVTPVDLHDGQKDKSA